MKITIHQGFRELGGCLMEIRSKKARILVDMGYPLVKDGVPIQSHLYRKSRLKGTPDADPGASLDHGPESGVLPVIEGLYHWDKVAFDAVILAKVDLDHENLLPWIHPDIPVWLSASTKTLIEQGRQFRFAPHDHDEFALFSHSRPFTIQDITILPFQLDQAAGDLSAFEISSGNKRFQYIGDFCRYDRHTANLSPLADQALRQADLLLVDGTAFDRDMNHNRTEEDIEQELVALMSEPGPFFFQCASQNISRIVTFYNACRNTRRQFIIDPFTANVLHEFRKLGFGVPSPGVGSDAMHVFGPRPGTPDQQAAAGREHRHRFSRWHVSRPQVMSMADRVCMLVRPSLLTDLRKMPALRGGQLIYSMPASFRATASQKRLEHLMLVRGTTIVPLHTSGHARIIDLNQLVERLAPKNFRLVHELQPALQKQLKNPVQVLRDQETIEI